MSSMMTVGAMVLLAALVSPTLAQSTTRAPAADHIVPQLTVQGHAELSKPADELQLRVAVVTEAATAGDALKANTDRMRGVMKAIEKLKLSPDELETGRFRVQPVYSRRPRQAEPDWRPQIVGYQVENSLMIKTARLEMAGEIIEAANNAGANAIDGIRFGLADARRYRSEAIAAATANAIADAQTLADAASLRLVRVITISLDHARAEPVVVPEARMARSMAVADSAPPISAGDVTVRASVLVAYEVEGRE